MVENIDLIAQERYKIFESELLNLAPGKINPELISSYTKEQINTFSETFYFYSKGKAIINRQQLTELLKKIMGADPSNQDVNFFMKKVFF